LRRGCLSLWRHRVCPWALVRKQCDAATLQPSPCRNCYYSIFLHSIDNNRQGQPQQGQLATTSTQRGDTLCIYHRYTTPACHRTASTHPDLSSRDSSVATAPCCPLDCQSAPLSCALCTHQQHDPTSLALTLAPFQSLPSLKRLINSQLGLSKR
jgi:hypothetical protein